MAATATNGSESFAFGALNKSERSYIYNLINCGIPCLYDYHDASCCSFLALP